MLEKDKREDMRKKRNKFFSKVFLRTLFIKQNEHHRYGVLLHTLKVTYATIKYKDYRFIIPALLHDVGKPVVAYQKEEDILKDEYSFTNHEEISYQMVKNMPFLSQWSKDIIRFHYIIRDRMKCKKKGSIKRLNRLNKQWDNFDKEFIKDLQVFLKYDDYGKR